MANRNVRELSEEDIQILASNECIRNGYELLNIREMPHKSDYYLRYVIAYNNDKHEYATWLYNIETDGLYYGHYFTHGNGMTKMEANQKALDSFYERD